MTSLVTVAIPVRNGGLLLDEVLTAVRAQRIEAAVELLVCDSGSTDDSVAIARRHGAELIQIRPEEFSHGATRNLLMQRAQGEHVAFLTQDAVPADELWLERFVSGFGEAEDVGLAFGPYRPRPDASPMVARELVEWFRTFSPDGRVRIDRLEDHERTIDARGLLGRRGFFTDANGCVLRAAWEQVPFRSVPYAEDHVLAHDMMRAGFAKVFVPEAAVVHSHEYSGWEWLGRSFDEARAMHEVYGFDEPGEWRRAALGVWGLVGGDLRWATGAGAEGPARPWQTVRLLTRSLQHRLLRAVGTMLGTRAHRLPAGLIRRLSLERRVG